MRDAIREFLNSLTDEQLVELKKMSESGELDRMMVRIRMRQAAIRLVSDMARDIIGDSVRRIAKRLNRR